MPTTIVSELLVTLVVLSTGIAVGLILLVWKINQTVENLQLALQGPLQARREQKTARQIRPDLRTAVVAPREQLRDDLGPDSEELQWAFEQGAKSYEEALGFIEEDKRRYGNGTTVS